MFSDADPFYGAMAMVLKRTCELYSPDTPITVRQYNAMDCDIAGAAYRSVSHAHNCRKTRRHAEIVNEAKDGEVLCLLDADMMVLRPLDVDMRRHDLAITLACPGNRYAFNTGTIVVKVSDATRRLFARWQEVAFRMMVDETLHESWRRNYGGVNQCALAAIIDDRGLDECGVKLLELETTEWNALNADHHRAMQVSRVVHLVGPLRMAVRRSFRNSCRATTQSHLRALQEFWLRHYEEAALC